MHAEFHARQVSRYFPPTGRAFRDSHDRLPRVERSDARTALTGNRTRSATFRA
jgi:hypothetical protein